MKRIALLMLLASVAGAEGPYVVRCSSGPREEFVGFAEAPNCRIKDVNWAENRKNGYTEAFVCYPSQNDCEWIYDLAESMNAAHERRREKCITDKEKAFAEAAKNGFYPSFHHEVNMRDGLPGCPK